MNIDFCFVTYNSSKWIKNCIESIVALNYDKKKLSLYFCDNNSSDNTINLLNEVCEEHKDKFNDFKIYKANENLGFGTGSNKAASMGKSKYVFMCNIDTELDVNSIFELNKFVNKHSEFAAFEMRQMPYEHPKFYNPITMEVQFASGACFVINRSIFEEVNGFDESLFMYAEDVDLSWRIRARGYKIAYVPSSVINHFTYADENEVKPVQISGSIVGNYVLRCKFGTDEDITYWKTLEKGAREYHKNNKDIINKTDELLDVADKYYEKYREYYSREIKDNKFTPSFYDFDYCVAKNGAFYINEVNRDESIKFSIIVRTFKRPELLKYTLNSLINQTYKNFEVIICEDGKIPLAQSIVNEYKGVLDIKYIPLMTSAGRCKSLNAGLSHATGDFINILDDDDYFFPEHLEIMKSNIDKNPDKLIFSTNSLMLELDSTESDTINFEPSNIINHVRTSITKRDLLNTNQIPIQSVCFCREILAEIGNIDENLITSYEDWDFWLRCSLKYNIVAIQKATTCFRVPKNIISRYKRNINMLGQLYLLREKAKSILNEKDYKLFYKYNNEDIVNQNINKLQDELNKIEADLYKSTTTLQFSKENYKILQSKIIKLEEETSVLKVINTSLESKYNDILNSITWRKTQFIRDIVAKLRCK